MPQDIETYVKAAGRAFAEQLRFELRPWQPTTDAEELGRCATQIVGRDLTGVGHPDGSMEGMHEGA